jgi:hypothetical protein
MSFREKVLWVAMLAPLGLWIWYFASVVGAWQMGTIDEGLFFGRMVFAVIVGVAVQVAAIIVIAIQNPKEASADADERERLIEYRGSFAAYNIIAFGVVTIIGGSYFGWTRFAVVNALLFVFLVAEVVKGAIEIRGFRRGF